jgi:hypothetical protein
LHIQYHKTVLIFLTHIIAEIAAILGIKNPRVGSGNWTTSLRALRFYTTEEAYWSVCFWPP